MAYKGIESLSFGEDLGSRQDSGDSFTINNFDTTVEINDLSYIKDATFLQDGMDLVLNGPNGSMTIEGYFSAESAPVLQGPNGFTLTPDLVNSFTQGGQQYAQTFSINDESPVGTIQELSGDATITRTDGSSENVTLGTPVFEGDIIQTGSNGALNITFSDESSFAISENSKMAIDEFVFDAGTEAGVSNFSMLKGAFVYISGMIGREDPDDVEIETPVGSIGIRGTTIAGDVDTGEITVVEGAIVLRDFQGNEMTLASQFETATFDSVGGSIINNGTLSANQMIDRYSAISSIAPDLFTSIRDQADEQQRQEEQQQDEKAKDAEEDAQSEDKGEASENNDTETPKEGEADDPILLKESGLLNKKLLDGNDSDDDGIFDLGLNDTEFDSVFDMNDENYDYHHINHTIGNTDQITSQEDFIYSLSGNLENLNDGNYSLDLPSGNNFNITNSDNNNIYLNDGSYTVMLDANSQNNTIYFGDSGAGTNIVDIGVGAEFTTIYGGAGSEAIAIRNSEVRIFAGGGDDTFYLFQSAFDGLDDPVNGTFNGTIIDGGGNDGPLGDVLVIGTNSGTTIDFSAIAAAGNQIRNIETIDTRTSPNDQTIILGYDDVVNMTDGDNTLIIQMESGDTLDLTDADFDTAGLADSGNDVMIDGLMYHEYTDGNITIYIHDDGGTATINT